MKYYSIFTLVNYNNMVINSEIKQNNFFAKDILDAIKKHDNAFTLPHIATFQILQINLIS